MTCIIKCLLVGPIVRYDPPSSIQFPNLKHITFDFVKYHQGLTLWSPTSLAFTLRYHIGRFKAFTTVETFTFRLFVRDPYEVKLGDTHTAEATQIDDMLTTTYPNFKQLNILFCGCTTTKRLTDAHMAEASTDLRLRLPGVEGRGALFMGTFDPPDSGKYYYD